MLSVYIWPYVFTLPRSFTKLKGSQSRVNLHAFLSGSAHNYSGYGSQSTGMKLRKPAHCNN